MTYRSGERPLVSWHRVVPVMVFICFALACKSPSTDLQRPPVRQALDHQMADSSFARLVAQLSESGGFFDTDNLLSNETSYLHVLGKMREMDVSGGAYLGVGPDQNFSYMAQIRPNIAFIIDIRRDNLLQHLFFKSLFSLSRNRLEYLCLLVGKPVPDDLEAWDERPLEALAAYVDQTPASPDAVSSIRERVLEGAGEAGLPISEADRAAIARIHAIFIEAGLGLRFTSLGQAPRAYYPTYRQLMLEVDLTGRQGNYLAREEDFQFLKSMHARDLIIPVVGDLGGPHALAAIGDWLTEQGEVVSAFYTSNVEFYLMRQRSFDTFAENVKHLPHDDRSVIIRSYFNRFRSTHPQSVPGYASTQLLQTIESLVEEYDQGGYRSYFDLVNKHALDVR